MKRVWSLRLTVFLLGCPILIGCSTTGQTAQNGALVRARSAMEHHDYSFALERLNAAESYRPPSEEVKAEILYLRAACYEGLNNPTEAERIYQSAAQTYGFTTFGRRAAERLRTKGGSL